MSNNLFNYATKELSQDAIICWLFKWIEETESPLAELAVKLFDLIGEHEINIGQKIIIKQQEKNADIVIIIKERKQVIIIEDKTYTCEHDEQIARYKEAISGSIKELGFESSDDVKIRTVYWKTGFYYDEDELLRYNKKADIFVDGKQFLDIISDYYGKSEILDSYIAYLGESLNYYEKYGDYKGRYGDGGYYLSWTYIAQYRFMRAIFPEELWNKESDLYKVYNGSSFGRPWTEMDIFVGLHENTSYQYYVFWRIDSDNVGPYLSLRVYDDFDKKDEERKKLHKEVYLKLVDLSKRVFQDCAEDIVFSWDEVKDGYKGGYKESSLFTIHTNGYLEKWSSSGEDFIKSVRLLNDKMICFFM